MNIRNLLGSILGRTSKPANNTLLFTSSKINNSYSSKKRFREPSVDTKPQKIARYADEQERVYQLQEQVSLLETIAQEQRHEIFNLNRRINELVGREQQRLKTDRQLSLLKLRHTVQKLQPQKERIIKETISEKLYNYTKNHSLQHRLFSPPKEHEANSGTHNYSQFVLLRNINLYLTKTHQPLISEIGYCHGITLLWLTMMAHNLENLFYNLVKEIAECPQDQLTEIHQTITTFLEWIEIGQHPEKHSTCTQRDTDQITGIEKIYTLDTQLSQHSFQLEIKKLAQENNMICIGANEHTIGLFYRHDVYHLFDSNYNHGKSTTFTSPKEAGKEAWFRLFNANNTVVNHKTEITIDVTNRHYQL